MRYGRDGGGGGGGGGGVSDGQWSIRNLSGMYIHQIYFNVDRYIFK